MYFLTILFIVSQISTLLCHDADQKIREAAQIASEVYTDYISLFQECILTSMPHRRFLSDNLHGYVNALSKTTVGYAPQFTSNRKFFANMISSPGFKMVIEKDVNELHKSLLEKIKFCDESINQDTLKHFYDREVDQTKL